MPVLDKDGNLYGATGQGGTYHLYGTVFELTQSGTETVLHGFDDNGTDGYDTQAGVIRGEKGNLYGTTTYGGAYLGGTVFKLTPSGVETILYSFNDDGTDGYYPLNGVVPGKNGNLYGTTYYGANGCGSRYGCGTVFELTQSGTETVLHSFGANGTDGEFHIPKI